MNRGIVLYENRIDGFPQGYRLKSNTAVCPVSFDGNVMDCVADGLTTRGSSLGVRIAGAPNGPALWCEVRHVSMPDAYGIGGSDVKSWTWNDNDVVGVATLGNALRHVNFEVRPERSLFWSMALGFGGANAPTRDNGRLLQLGNIIEHCLGTGSQRGFELDRLAHGLVRKNTLRLADTPEAGGPVGVVGSAAHVQMSQNTYEGGPAYQAPRGRLRALIPSVRLTGALATGVSSVANVGTDGGRWRIERTEPGWLQARIDAGAELGPEQVGGVLAVGLASGQTAESGSWGQVVLAGQTTRSLVEGTAPVPEATQLYDVRGNEFGVRFKVQRSGRITKLRFMKVEFENSASYRGRVWSSNGTLLRTVDLPSGNAGVWLEGALSEPLPVEAGGVFVVSVNSSVNGWLAFKPGGLRGLNENPDGVMNEVVAVHGTAPGAFPATVDGDTSYFRDVVLELEENQVVGVQMVSQAGGPTGGMTTGTGSTTGGSTTAISGTTGGSTTGGGTAGATGSSTGGGTGLGSGLRAEIYSGVTLAGEARVRRVDATVDFNWGTGSPAPTVASDLFSIRWTGALQAPSSGRYTVRTQSDDGVRLWVGDRLVINNWSDHAATFNTAQIDLIGGVKVPLRMEYYERRGRAVARLQWRTPGSSAFVAIPTACLFPHLAETYILAGSGTPETAGTDGDYELGMKFQTSALVNARGIRFYKMAGETGAHAGRLWTDDGQLLASATFQTETASGWQSVALEPPVPLEPGRTYTVSVNCNVRYAFTREGLAAGVTAGPLSSVVGNNGVFNEAPGRFPASSYFDSDYSVGIEVE